ncbi:MAG: helix-hairpin-helix domain-containing protein [Oscillospiraceae bacterium]|nr:helix-hairpin-helix domain-containing protein [Oscillospiraceae bacterium]
MKLRRIEFIIVGVTLAFAFFMGGFFTGRSWNAVSIVSTAAHSGDSYSAGVSVLLQEPYVNSAPVSQQEAQRTENSYNETQQPVPAAAPGENTAEAAGQPKNGDGKININLATQSELTDLPGIGNVLASRIIDYRRQHGDFSRIEDLRNVSGIGEKRYEAIAGKITTG